MVVMARVLPSNDPRMCSVRRALEKSLAKERGSRVAQVLRYPAGFSEVAAGLPLCLNYIKVILNVPGGRLWQ